MQWMSVTEAKPNEEQWCLVFCEFGVQVDLFVKGYFENGLWSKTVTHWMPLPEPPTASNNEFKATKAP
ncbi:hypothetical protein [Tetrasphaera phage TJE1]|uniref:DUF551 domain-containing protein n=1 Tax=Tetrasphaera phage TJE1 TaxID=981335 RepID=G4W933_9CAUD|nr:hypothetical protein G185_gp19 [Tetrasphaera phage TJE1]ADX42521.1 hypothetical protein [Tetrasphaera phage TJE1]